MSRKERVESAIREQLADLIAREVRDPRVQAAGVLGVSQVECTSDLSVARVWISIYTDDDKVAEKALAGLRAAAGFLRGPLGRRLQIQRPPELRFEHDVTAVMSQKLRDIVKDDEARAQDAAAAADPASVAAADDSET
ncbi:MAG: 30S ribosome-binding factor RbfA [Deltaproteobacteria bacterium]|nr:30S ribosome-binding factor RbfA [Kofleriaceae bacterium]